MKTDQATRAEAGYRSLFHRIPVPLYRSTPDGEGLAVNPAMVEMLRYPDADTLLRTRISDVYVDPEERERFRDALLREGEIVGFEARLRRRDGSEIWVRDSARAVSDEDGTVMYFEGAMLNVTDQKLADKQLRRQTGELAGLHETTLGLIEQLDFTELLDALLSRAAELLDTEHAYLYVVDGDELVVRAGVGLFIDFVGYRLGRGEGLAGRVWVSGEPYAVDDYRRWSARRLEFPFIRAAAALPLRTGSEVVGVIGLVRTDQDRPFNAMEMGLISRFGRMASLVLTNARVHDTARREITERRRLEEEERHARAALAKSEHRYRTLVEATSEWIWSMDLEGRLTASNGALRDILGYEPEAVIGTSSLDIIHPEDRREVESWLPTAMAEGRGWSNLIVRWRHRDGGYRWLESTGLPLLDDEGELVGFWGADRDITERILLEGERRGLIGELVRVQEEERRRIATEIHDDPVQAMTAVEMRLESLRRRVTDDEQRRVLEQLAASVSSAIERLRRLLVDLRPPRLDREGLGPAIRALLDRLRSETGVQTSLEDRTLHEIPPDRRTVLYRIAQEALANVRKHAGAGSVRVAMAERDGGFALRVRDDGIGFEPGRVPEERPGHLGLVSMRERAELAGGKFRVISAPGAGTRVDAWIPGEVGDD